MENEKNPPQDKYVLEDNNQKNLSQYKSMILCYDDKRYPIQANIFDDLVRRKIPHITLYDDSKNQNLILFFDYIPLVIHIKSLVNPQKHIIIPIKGLHKRKGDIIQIVQSRLIDDINNYFELNFYDLNEYYLLEGKIDKGPDLERISRQKARRDSKRHSAHISNSSRVKKLLGKDESYYRDRSEGYNLSSTFESDSETAWLHDGFCDEKTNEYENEDEEDDFY